MTNEEYSKIITEIETLPTGGITYKKINGKAYAYYQWREDGKQRSRRIQDEELEQLSGQIISLRTRMGTGWRLYRNPE